MTATIGQHNQIDDAAADGKYYSIYVPDIQDPVYKKNPDGTKTDITPLAATSYFRLGEADSTAETSELLPKPAGETGSYSTNFDPGILLYTNGHYQQIMSQHTQWSSDSLSINTNGTDVVAANYVSPGGGATINFQKQSIYNSTLGDSSNFLTGNQLNYWLGNSASTGLGSLLWSNLGVTQNVFGGQVTNIYNTGIDVQGFGETKIQESYDLTTTGGLTLSVQALPAYLGCIEKISAAISLITIAMSAVALTGSDLLQEFKAKSGPDDTANDTNTYAQNIRSALTESLTDLEVITGAIGTVQLIVTLTGLTMSRLAKAASATALSGIQILPTGVGIIIGGEVVQKWGAAGNEEYTLTKKVQAANISHNAPSQQIQGQ